LHTGLYNEGEERQTSSWRGAVGAATLSAHILVVDDDPLTSQAVRLLFEAEGLTVDDAANGREALERLSTSRPALILLDLAMPVMDGRTFRKYQLDNPSLATIPVILLSAEADLQEEARYLGIRRAFRKPVDLQKLVASIRDEVGVSPA
jgi:CheY-like chemotaxis protein